jgi:hypothetical protein
MMKFAQAAAKPDFVLLGAKFVQIMQRPFQLLDATALLMPVFTNSGIASATLAAVRHHAIGQMAVWIRAEGARGPRLAGGDRHHCGGPVALALARKAEPGSNATL